MPPGTPSGQQARTLRFGEVDPALAGRRHRDAVQVGQGLVDVRAAGREQLFHRTLPPQHDVDEQGLELGVHTLRQGVVPLWV